MDASVSVKSEFMAELERLFDSGDYAGVVAYARDRFVPLLSQCTSAEAAWIDGIMGHSARMQEASAASGSKREQAA